jgi:hypothetical protein
VENYLKIQGIEKKEVTSFFPFLSKEKYWKLNDSSDCYVNTEEQKTKYLLLSNIHNDAPDSLFNIYSKENALYYVKSGAVWMGLFQNKKE